MRRFCSICILVCMISLCFCGTACGNREKLSEMEWEKCRSKLVKLGVDIPEEFDDPGLQDWIAQIEEDPYGHEFISSKPANDLYHDLCDAVKEYYDLPEEDPEYGS